MVSKHVVPVAFLLELVATTGLNSRIGTLSWTQFLGKESQGRGNALLGALL
jgi:hypothetical protein